jgi:hypothetical protein
MTTHTVEAVGRPLLGRGAAGLPRRPFTARLRVSDQPDVIHTGGVNPDIGLGPADHDAQPALTTDAAARVLLLWGRQPADMTRIRSDVGPDQLGTVRALLRGY